MLKARLAVRRMQNARLLFSSYCDGCTNWAHKTGTIPNAKPVDLTGVATG
jgi:hypothetical protein